MNDLDYARLCQRLGYAFRDRRWLERALTHRSANRRDHNERLEFLGDAELGRITARWLFDHFPEAPEGALTRMRSQLVRGETLAQVALSLDLGAALILGSAEMKSGGHRRESILADAFEAVCGAVLVDGGEQVCRERVLAWLGPWLEQVSPERADKDAKTRLQEWLQGRQLALPEYQVLAVHGQAPHQQFDVNCRLTDHGQAFQARGSSRRRAEQEAAALALAWLEEQS